MKRVCSILVLFLCCAWLAGCGRQEENTQATGYMDILPDAQEMFELDGYAGVLVGMQFYQGEAVQIRAVRNNGVADIYLYHADGSRETLLEGISDEYSFATWFMDSDRNFYCWNMDGITKKDSSGKNLFNTSLEGFGSINDMCQLTDGRVLFTYMPEGGATSYILAELDAVTGRVSKESTVKLGGFGRVASGGENLLYMTKEGIYGIDMESGKKSILLSFSGTSYILQEGAKDFRMLEDGSAEILWYDKETNVASSEVLQKSEETTEKTILTLRCYNISGENYGVEKWLKEQIAIFNQQSESYLVVLDEYQGEVGRGNVEMLENNMEDFARQTSIEIAAGKGPDLLYGNVLGEYTYGAIQKGALVDLKPYMDASGIREEDYFPAAFDCWREGDGVYGVSPVMSFETYRIDERVLGGREEPDVESLVDALLAWEEDSVFLENRGKYNTMKYFLEGSEDLWGMIDWEAGTCDFSGGLFAGILEVSRRYGYDETRIRPAVAESRRTDIVSFDTAANREEEGMVVAGALFDDGCHPVLDVTSELFGNKMMAINANSPNIEGAWEFISFLLGEEAMSAFEDDNPHMTSFSVPVNKKAFDTCMEKRIVELGNRDYSKVTYADREYIRYYDEMTEEKIAEYKATMEDARALPLRTAPILDIVLDEAWDYFDGTKSIEEVVAVIQNRVQLYMDENK